MHAGEARAAPDAPHAAMEGGANGGAGGGDVSGGGDAATEGHDGRARDGMLAAAVRVVSGLTVLSRVLGLARDVATAHAFGNTALGSAFRAAFAIPNLFRRLFGEGALSAAFIPEYARLGRDDPARADQLASLVVRLLVLATGAATIVLELGLMVVLWRNAHRPETALSVRLIMLMLPMMPLVCLTAVLGGMLQTHGRFGPAAAAPVILNLFQIAAAGMHLAGLPSGREAGAYAVGVSALLASVAQVAWALRALRGSVRWTRARDLAREAAGRVRTRFLPAVVGLGTLQLNTFLDMAIAMWPNWFGPTMFGRPCPLDEDSNAILSYTQALYQFPLGVFGIAVATAVFPLLASAADSPGEFARTLRRGVRLSMYIGLPASAGLLLVRHDLVAALYAGRSSGFTPDGVARSAGVLAGFALAVWAYSLNHVLTRAYYAKGDTTTPMRVAIACIALNLALNLSLIWTLEEAGLAWATACGACAQGAALLALAPRRLGVTPIDAETARALARVLLATLIMAALVGLALWAMAPAGSWRGHALRLGVGTLGGAGAYAALSLALRIPELRWLMHPAPRGHGGTPIPMGLE